MTRTIKLTILTLLTLWATATYSQLNSVYFGKNGYELTDSAKTKLDDFFSIHLSTNTPEVVVKGYSDTTGTSDINLKLSQQRVETVKSYLATKGYPSHRIILKYFGETETQEENLWKNRRVDLYINPDFAVYDYLTDFQNKAQQFKIINTKDTVIYGQGGTVIFIPAKCFITTSGKVVKNATIWLTEYYQSADMLTSNLSTMAENGDILETSGMIYIKANTNGEKCEIAKTASVSIGFPNVKENNLYQGQVYHKQVQWKSENTVEPIEYGISLSMSGFNYSEIGFSNVLNNYLRENLDYPIDALQNGVCGISRIQFNLDSKGIVNTVSLRDDGLYASIDKQVIEVIGSAPQLTPAYKKDKKALKHFYSATFQFSSSKCKSGYKRYSLDKWENEDWLIQNPKPSGPDSIELSDVKNISTVIYTTTQLGWLNVDKLKRFPGKKVKIEIAYQPVYNVDFKIVLNNYGSIVIGDKRKDSFVFSKLPQGQKGILIGLKYDKDKIYLTKTEIIMDNITIEDIDFKEVTVSQLRDELTEIK